MRFNKVNLFISLCVSNAFVLLCFYIRHARRHSYEKTSTIDDKALLETTFRLSDDGSITIPNTESYRQHVFDTFYQPVKNPAAINCTRIVNNNQREIEKAKLIMENSSYTNINLKSEFYLQNELTCEEFRTLRGYIDHPLSNIELHFPIAYGILVYKDVEQFDRLLRSIYRPQNVYCLHLDIKTKSKDRRAFEKIVSCFDNIQISGKSVDVQWGQFSLLEAELTCMKTLWPYKKWKYYINLTGQEFPLKTNRDIVSILKAVDGANIVDGTYIRERLEKPNRWSGIKVPPPHNITVVKGSVHVAANRHFVDFVLHDRRSRDFLKWLRLTKVPDETFFASLNHNPHLGIIGSFVGDIEEYYLKPFFMRYVTWYPGRTGSVRECSGKYVREVCVLGVGDLYRAYNNVALFANKFHLDFEPLALDCLEELMHERTWKQYVNDIDTDTSYYKHLDYARLQLKAK